jgi:lambda repressor-like predicted transcriptional regulator
MRGAGGGPPRQPRVPLAPLIDALVKRGALQPAGYTVYDVARAVGLSPPVTTSALQTGQITVYAADRAAIAGLNVHPTHIWGDEWLDQEWLHHPNVNREVRADMAFAQLRQAVAS